MSDREPLSWIEIDMDGCSLTFGEGACPAALGVNGVQRKCYNTFATCRAKAAFVHDKEFRTLRICEPRSNLPKDGTWFPMLESVTEEPGTVNIAGSDDDMAALGRRGAMKATVTDAPYHDRFLDPYQAQRVSGAAQIDEPGYEPADRGTLWGKTVARWPYYSGRAIRRCVGFLVDGALVDIKRRHYVLTSRSGPGTGGSVSFEAADVLDLAKNDKAVAPRPSNGSLALDLASDGTSLTLVPPGVGDAEYPAEGRACIGNEIVTYTRVGDLVTLTGRGIARTAQASQSAGSTFQQVLFIDRKRVHEIIDILLGYTTVDPARYPGEEDAAEIMRWLPSVVLTRHITKPTGVASLIGELALFGVSIWPSNVLNRIRLKANRPVDNDEIFDLSDRNNIIEVSRKDRDDKRLTQVHIHSVLSDPTKGTSTGAENYDRLMATVDLSAQEAWAFGEVRIRKIFTAWLEGGNDSVLRICSLRLLRRFLSAPAHLTLLLDEKDDGIDLADVLRLFTDALQDETGKTVTSLYQVIEREEAEPGHQFEVTAQSYQFSGRFGVIPPNGTPDYVSATQEQRDRFMFITANSAPWLPDGSPHYEIF